MSAGVKKGDRVAVSLGNSIEYAIVCVPEGGWRCGADVREGNLWYFQTRRNPGESHRRFVGERAMPFSEVV